MVKKKLKSDRKELARLYYMQHESQKAIAGKIGVSEHTICRWVQQEGWESKRAATSITRPELVNKLLLSINTLIDQTNESEDPALMAGLADKLAKFASVIEKLDKKASTVDSIEVFIAFSKWLEYRMSADDEAVSRLIETVREILDKKRVKSDIKVALMSLINHYQDFFITEQIRVKN